MAARPIDVPVRLADARHRQEQQRLPVRDEAPRHELARIGGMDRQTPARLGPGSTRA
jgi:hypothetical protein